MSFTQKATRGHFIVGVILILISFIALILELFIDLEYIGVAIHIFGVWGGVEIGRFIEAQIHEKYVDKMDGDI